MNIDLTERKKVYRRLDTSLFQKTPSSGLVTFLSTPSMFRKFNKQKSIKTKINFKDVCHITLSSNHAYLKKSTFCAMQQIEADAQS